MNLHLHGLAWRSAMLGVGLAAMASCGGDNSSPSDDTIAKAPTNSGDDQTGPVGQALANALRVLVTVDGEPQPDVSVTWSTTDGSLAPSSVATDADGISATTWTLGTTTGTQTALATLEGASGSPVTFTATATAATITIAKAPTSSGDRQTAAPGQALPNQLRVLVTVDGEPGERDGHLVHHRRIGRSHLGGDGCRGDQRDDLDTGPYGRRADGPSHARGSHRVARELQRHRRRERL